MAVKASATITLTSYRDTQSVTRYYKLQPAGSSAPLKPETKPPSSDWTDSEPACDISKELYFCDLTIFSNGEGEYSKVSKSTSYEAAKEAYNRANAAKDSIDNLEIGGRNYVVKTDSFSLTVNGITFDYDGDVYHVYGTNTKTDTNYFVKIFVDRTNVFEPGAVYTVSTTTPLPSGLYLGINTRNSIGTEIIAASNSYFHGDGSKTSKTFTCTQDTNGELRGFFGVEAHCGTVDVTFKIKLEKGNKATDWTPAPEDVASKDELASTNESIRQDVENNYYSHTELGQSLSFNETDGLIIQVPNSPYETRISNTQIEFRYQGQPVAYINGEILVIPKSMMLDEMMVGNNKWSWRIRDNGNLQLKWIG